MTGFFASFLRPQRTTFFGAPIADETPRPDADDQSPQAPGQIAAERIAPEQLAPEQLAPEQLAMTAVRPPPTTPADTPGRRAQVILGETAGLYPESIDPTKSPWDPGNWVPDSADNLAAARKYVGIVAGRNANTRPAIADLSNPIEMRAWNDALNAAQAAQRTPNLLDPKIDHFYIRHEGDVRRPWPELYGYLTVGPFRNVGGRGSTGTSNKTFIEFYGRK